MSGGSAISPATTACPPSPPCAHDRVAAGAPRPRAQASDRHRGRSRLGRVGCCAASPRRSQRDVPRQVPGVPQARASGLSASPPRARIPQVPAFPSGARPESQGRGHPLRGAEPTPPTREQRSHNPPERRLVCPAQTIARDVALCSVSRDWKRPWRRSSPGCRQRWRW